MASCINLKSTITKALLAGTSLAILSFFTPSTGFAAGVSADLDILSEPTLTALNKLDSSSDNYSSIASAYSLGDVPASDVVDGEYLGSDFVIKKYLESADEDGNTVYTAQYYSVNISSTLGSITGDTLYFAWTKDSTTGALSLTTKDSDDKALTAGNSDFSYTYDSTGALSDRLNNESTDAKNITNSYVGSNYDLAVNAGKGGAIYNGNANSIIGDITGDFIGNYVSYSSNDVYGGAIYNRSYASSDTVSTIGNITGDFVANYAYSSSKKAYGGAIYNEYSYATTSIGDITGDFIANYVYSGSSYAYGGAIYNDGATIGNMLGNFIANYAYSGGSYSYAGAIYNDDASISGITGDFIGNYAYSGGSYAHAGAIYNISSASIGDITGDFIGNYAYANMYVYGGAIYNKKSTISAILGDFIANSATAINASSTAKSGGGAIYNEASNSTTSIDSIKGDFLNNYASGATEAKGGAIYNYASGSSSSKATIGVIIGDFFDNYVSSSKLAQGGAIYNATAYSSSTATIADIKGDFFDNYAISDSSSKGGVIYNYASYSGNAHIGNITGDFIANYASASASDSTAQGGVIYSEVNATSNASVGNITGDFIANYASASALAQGGVIYNYASASTITATYVSTSTVGVITGDFIANYAYASDSESTAQGGVICNYASTGISTSKAIISSIEGDFINNYANGGSIAQGGAIYNDGINANIELLATTDTYSYVGNFATTKELTWNDDGSLATELEAIDDENGGFLYINIGNVSFNTVDANSSITIGDGTVGYDSIASYGDSAVINKTGAGTLTVNSSMESFLGTMYLQAGSFKLNNTFGGTLYVTSGTLTVGISSNNVDSTAIIKTLTLDSSYDASNPYTINVSYADDLSMSQCLSTVTIFTADEDLKNIVSLNVSLASGESSYDWTISKTYNTVTLSASMSGDDGDDSSSLDFSSNEDGSTTVDVSGDNFYLGENDSVEIDSIVSDDGSSLVLNGGEVVTTGDSITITGYGDEENNGTALEIRSGTVDASADGAAVNVASSSITAEDDLTFIGTLNTTGDTVLDSDDSNLSLDKVVLRDDAEGNSASLTLTGTLSASNDEGVIYVSTASTNESTSSATSVDGTLNDTVSFAGLDSVSISATSNTASAVILENTSLDGASVDFDSSVVDNKTAVSTNVDTVYGDDLVSSDSVITASVSTTYTSSTEGDSSTLAAISTTGGVINLANGISVSATFIDSEGNESYGNALTNSHEVGDNIGLTVAIELGGTVSISGNIVANSPLTLSSTTTTIDNTTVVTTGTTLSVAGGYITTNADKTSKTTDYLKIDGIDLVLTTDGDGTMASFKYVGDIDLANSGTISVETSADMLVGASYEIADDTTLANNDDFYDLITYGDSFTLTNGVLTLSSLSDFQDAYAGSNVNILALATSLDELSTYAGDADYQDKVDFKSSMSSESLSSYVMSANSYIAEVNTMLLSNQNFANVNRARSILEKSNVEVAMTEVEVVEEATGVSVVESEEIEAIKYSNVAQLQVISLMGNKNASNGVAGYDYYSVGSTANFDEILSDNALIGASIGGTYNKVTGDAGESANSTTFLLNAYAVYAYEGFEFFGNIGYAHFWNEGSKAGASADWDSDAFNGLVGVSYKMETALEGLSISPVAMLNLVCQDADSASYSNGVNVDDQSYFSAKLMLGFEVEYAINAQFNVLARAMYSHEMGDTSYDNTYSFANGFVNGVNYIGSEAGADSAVMGLGLSYDFSEACTAYFDYNAYAYTSLITHSLNLSVALKF